MYRTTRLLLSLKCTASTPIRMVHLNSKFANFMKNPKFLSNNLTEKNQNSQQRFCHHLTNEDSKLTNIDWNHGEHLVAKFKDEKTCPYSYVWLRDNCQCKTCFDADSLARKVLPHQYSVDVVPTSVQVNETIGSVAITWDDGHQSVFEGSWLYDRGLKIEERKKFEKLKQVPWGANATIKEYNYNDLFTDKSKTLDFMVTIEKEGIALVRKMPSDTKEPGDAQKLQKHLSFPRRTHYGDHSLVYARAVSNNLAFTPAEIGLHGDLAYYDYMPGVIFLHMIHTSVKGGDSVLADSLYAANILRETDPETFEILCKTEVSFWDKGVAGVGETDSFFKINTRPIIELDPYGRFKSCGFHPQGRDSYLYLPVEKTKKFYKALKKYNDIMYQNSFEIRLESGEMVVLDNKRCLHGRKAYEMGDGERYLDNMYIDWDEFRCKRRRLQIELNRLDIE